MKGWSIMSKMMLHRWIGWGLGIVLTLSACRFSDDKPAIGESVRKTAVESRSIAITHDGAFVITANIDVPTISVVDTKSQTVTAEIPVGKEPRNIALSPDEKTAYVTAMHDNQVNIVDLQARKIVDSIAVPHQPFAVVTSPDGSRLYVTSFRGNAVYVIDTASRKVVNEVKVESDPRGLALSADGKELYISHYYDGKLTVLDTETLAVNKVIALAESPEPANHDQKVSQGLPGMVENMTFSPDGKQLWIPHILTNVDTVIQFQSTIFPAVSLIDTAKKEELTSQRKQLFKQMNIRNVQNKTEIVANPADVAFIPDGSKAFVVMSGSEDLMTFDLKKGGNATHLLRHIPGDNPRGIVLSPDGQTLYVHNALSHDLVSVATGGSDSYVKAQIVGKPLRLIAKDPLPPDVRAGKAMFFSANSSEYAAPLTGDNWMSCASCHFDGEINRLTLLTPKGPRNVPSNVLVTKTGLLRWDGSRDELADYLLTVQEEMGGMQGIDPSKPMPPEVEDMFNKIFAYLDDPDSLPVPKSPYRQANGELTPLAKEGEALFRGKAGCIACHALPHYTISDRAVDAQGKLSTAITSVLKNVGTAAKGDVASKGDARAHFSNPRDAGTFDVPTLRGVWATAPYFHDGSAATIYDVIVPKNPHVKMGNVQNLTKHEIDALVEYVLSIE
jgi:YVTN family beta-propeller protein